MCVFNLDGQLYPTWDSKQCMVQFVSISNNFLSQLVSSSLYWEFPHNSLFAFKILKNIWLSN